MASVRDVFLFLIVAVVLVASLEGAAVIGAIGVAAGRFQDRKRRIGILNLIGAAVVFAAGVAVFFSSQCSLVPALIVAFYVTPIIHLGVGAKLLAHQRIRFLAASVALFITGWSALTAIALASFHLRCALCPTILGR